MDIHDKIRQIQEILKILGLKLSEEKIEQLAKGETIPLDQLGRSLDKISRAADRAKGNSKIKSVDKSGSGAQVCIEKCCLNISLQGLSAILTYT
jgi:hypothetical protein